MKTEVCQVRTQRQLSVADGVPVIKQVQLLHGHVQEVRQFVRGALFRPLQVNVNTGEPARILTLFEHTFLRADTPLNQD